MFHKTDAKQEKNSQISAHVACFAVRETAINRFIKNPIPHLILLEACSLIAC
jgi:hypothetical protein